MVVFPISLFLSPLLGPCCPRLRTLAACNIVLSHCSLKSSPLLVSLSPPCCALWRNSCLPITKRSDIKRRVNLKQYDTNQKIKEKKQETNYLTSFGNLTTFLGQKGEDSYSNNLSYKGYKSIRRSKLSIYAIRRRILTN